MYGHVSGSGGAADAACDGMSFHTLGSHTHVAGSTSSVLGYHHLQLNRLPEPAAADVAGSDGQSAELAGSNTPDNNVPHYDDKY